MTPAAPWAPLGILGAVVVGIVMGQVGGPGAATSLLAIVPTVAAGVWRQNRYGNVGWRASVAIGLASIPGVIGGTYLAVWLDERTLQRLFGVLLIGVAAQLAWRARSK